MSELKPCPFCGGEAKLYSTGLTKTKIYSVGCMKCKVQYPFVFADERMAIETWNRRKEEVKHGEWNYIPETYFTCAVYECSVCKTYQFSPHTQSEYQYCPRCGAKMDGGRVSADIREELSQ